MKNIESVLVMGFLFFIAFLGLYFLVDDIANTSTINLDEESTNIILQYNQNYNNTLNNQSFIGDINTTGLPNYEGVAAEAREAAEAKGIVTSLTDLWDIFVVFPAVVLASLPFIDVTTATYIVLIIQAFLGILTIYVLIGLYKAWRTGSTNT